MPMKDLMNELKVQIEKGQEIENKKNLLPGETIAQTSNQGIYTPSPASTQISSTQSSLSHNKINSKNSQYIIRKLQKINTDKIEPKEFLNKIKNSFQIIRWFLIRLKLTLWKSRTNTVMKEEQ